MLATEDDSAVSPFKKDPIVEILSTFNLFVAGGLSLDGIEYEISFASRFGIEGSLRFRNPREPALQALPHILFQTSDQNLPTLVRDLKNRVRDSRRALSPLLKTVFTCRDWSFIVTSTRMCFLQNRC